MTGGMVSSSPMPHMSTSASPAGTPTKPIDTLMGGEPLTETDQVGNTRFYPMFVKSDGTQYPVSAEYLHAMGIDWPPPVPVHIHSDLAAMASELYQQAVANSQQTPANRSTHTHTASGPANNSTGCGGSQMQGIHSIDAMAATGPPANCSVRGVSSDQLKASAGEASRSSHGGDDEEGVSRGGGGGCHAQSMGSSFSLKSRGLELAVATGDSDFDGKVGVAGQDCNKGKEKKSSNGGMGNSSDSTRGVEGQR